MLTFPAVRNHELSNIRIFNQGKPVHMNQYGDIFDNKEEEKETNVLNYTPGEFVKHMSTGMNGLLKEVTKSACDGDKINFKHLLISNNRLTYIGFLLIFSTIILWIFYQ